MSERKRIRVVGCGASPSDICLSNDFMISLKHFSNVVSINPEAATVTVQGGIKLCDLNIILEQNDLALPVYAVNDDANMCMKQLI